MAHSIIDRPTIEQAILAINSYANVYTSTTEPIDYIQNRTQEQLFIAFREYSLHARTVLLQIYCTLQPLVCTNPVYHFCLQQAFLTAERRIHEKFGTTPILYQYGSITIPGSGSLQSGSHL